MYSNDEVQIRQGLVSYIGAILSASPLEGRQARQHVVAILIEEALKLAKQDNGLDIYALKPLLRGTLFVLKHRLSELSGLPRTKEIEKVIKDYESTIAHITTLIEKIK